MLSSVRLYLDRQASSLFRYILEQFLYFLFGWVPTVIGVGLRGVFYRLILHMDGTVAIESRVRLRFADHIRLGHGVYLDESVYLHACPRGIEIGPGTIVMHGAVLHVYNFRNIPQSGIKIGRDSLIGEYSVIRGQGGVEIGDWVGCGPDVKIWSVNHRFEDPDRPWLLQGWDKKPVRIEDDVWLGAGVFVMPGITIGKGAIISACALVNKSIPPYALVAGNPARVVGWRKRPEDAPAPASDSVTSPA